MEKAIKKNRALNLTENRISAILMLIDTWAVGKLTWNALIQAIADATEITYTRQALAKHLVIQEAYNEKNKILANNPVGKKESGIPALDDALKKLDQQKLEILRLKKTESRLLEQFARWAANAYVLGVDYHRLDDTIAPVDRDSSLQSKKKIKAVEI